MSFPYSYSAQGCFRDLGSVLETGKQGYNNATRCAKHCGWPQIVSLVFRDGQPRCSCSPVFGESIPIESCKELDGELMGSIEKSSVYLNVRDGSKLTTLFKSQASTSAKTTTVSSVDLTSTMDPVITVTESLAPPSPSSQQTSTPTISPAITGTLASIGIILFLCGVYITITTLRNSRRHSFGRRPSNVFKGKGHRSFPYTTMDPQIDRDETIRRDSPTGLNQSIGTLDLNPSLTNIASPPPVIHETPLVRNAKFSIRYSLPSTLDGSPMSPNQPAKVIVHRDPLSSPIVTSPMSPEGKKVSTASLSPTGIASWSCDDVSGALAKFGVSSECISKLRGMNINGYRLLLLSMEQLEFMGIDSESSETIMYAISRIAERELRADGYSKTLPRYELPANSKFAYQTGCTFRGSMNGKTVGMTDVL
ncbi:hypothetical protein HDU97_010033 [Phlyctochytrium planicorne]|nr:hypothetical protein HDU97_010033 [Phlyctochytrium planicorne]